LENAKRQAEGKAEECRQIVLKKGLGNAERQAKKKPEEMPKTG
jgi:hypothetical protein